MSGVSVFVLHLGATLFMTGVIWVIQLVHYPLFDRVSPEHFVAFEAAHSYWITWVVLPPMVTQLLTAFFLCWRPPAFLPLWLIWAGAALTVGTWLSTFVLSVPQHQQLSMGFDTQAHQLLVRTNWVRNACWSLHSGLLLYGLRDLLSLLQHKI